MRLLDWLYSWVSRPVPRTQHQWEALSPGEVALFRRCKCPDCLEKRLLKGPEGGGCVNVYCGNAACGSGFNEMGVFGVERINEAQPNRPRASR